METLRRSCKQGKGSKTYLIYERQSKGLFPNMMGKSKKEFMYQDLDIVKYRPNS